MRAYFDALNADPYCLRMAWKSFCAMAAADKLRVCLCYGGVGEKQFGFGAEVGRG
jgi:hypothetical protein